MMQGKFNKTERRGLPGGPNEQFTYITGVFSTQGYKRNSPDVDNPFNVIPSGNITMKDVDFPVYGVDNLGNEKIMYPEEEHHFPGSMVYETPLRRAQQGGEFQRLVKKYTTQGWASLTPQEQQFYRETYQRGGSLPRYQRKGEVLTYQNNPEYFDNKAVLGNNIRYSDLVKKRVYAGTHGYNPTTGEMVKLDSPQGGATGLDLAYSKREEDRSKDEQSMVQKQGRRNRAFQDLQALYRNPLFYAPSAIATAGTLGPAALANPYVQAGLTGLGVYDATTHSIPGAVKATKEGRYLDAAGNTAMASLDLLPIPFFGTNLVQEAKTLLGKSPKLIKPPKGAIDANDNLLPNINTKGLSKKDIEIAKKLWGEQMTNTRFVNQPFEQVYNRFTNPKLFVEKYKKYKKEYPNLNDKELSFIIGKDKDVLMASDEYVNLKHISKDPKFDQYLLKEGLYDFKTDLTPLEAYLQSKYTHGYDDVLNAVNRKVGNKHLDYENIDPSYVNFLKESSDQLNSLIQKTKFNLPTNVFRNIHDDHIVKVYDKSGNFLRDDKFKNIKVGESYIEEGFSSTSVPSRAKPKGHRDMSKESMKIEIPGGKKQSFLHPNEFTSLTKYPDESEALLPRGLRFEKTKMRDRETNDDFYSHWKILNPYQQGGSLPKAQRGFNLDDFLNINNLAPKNTTPVSESTRVEPSQLTKEQQFALLTDQQRKQKVFQELKEQSAKTAAEEQIQQYKEPTLAEKAWSMAVNPMSLGQQLFGNEYGNTPYIPGSFTYGDDLMGYINPAYWADKIGKGTVDLSKGNYGDAAFNYMLGWPGIAMGLKPVAAGAKAVAKPVAKKILSSPRALETLDKVLPYNLHKFHRPDFQQIIKSSPSFTIAKDQYVPSTLGKVFLGEKSFPKSFEISAKDAGYLQGIWDPKTKTYGLNTSFDNPFTAGKAFHTMNDLLTRRNPAILEKTSVSLDALPGALKNRKGWESEFFNYIPLNDMAVFNKAAGADLKTQMKVVNKMLSDAGKKEKAYIKGDEIMVPNYVTKRDYGSHSLETGATNVEWRNRIPYNTKTGKSIQDEYVENLKKQYESPMWNKMMDENYPNVNKELFKERTLANVSGIKLKKAEYSPYFDAFKGAPDWATGIYYPRPQPFHKYTTIRNTPLSEKVDAAYSGLTMDQRYNPNSLIGRSFVKTPGPIKHEIDHQKWNSAEFLPGWLDDSFLHFNLKPEKRFAGSHGYKKLDPRKKGEDKFYHTKPPEYAVRQQRLLEDLKANKIVDYFTEPVTLKHVEKLKNMKGAKVSSDSKDLFEWYPTKFIAETIKKGIPIAAGVAGTGVLLNQQKKGGSINLDPAKKGTFKALATRYGMSMDKLAMDMKKNPDKYSPGARKKANFYRNFVMQSGGSTENKQFEIYQNYINSIFDEVSEEEAEKVYDKLNRIYYRDAKQAGMSPANYIMTHIIQNV